MTDDDALAAARYLAQTWPAEAMIAPETGYPVCVQTTRFVVDAFHVAGAADVRPMPCALHCWNPAATFALTQGKKVPDDGCIIRVGPGHGPEDGRGWKGHLIVDHPRFLLDLVLPGVATSLGVPGFEGIEALCVEKEQEAVMVKGAWHVMTVEGMTFRYEPLPKLKGWRKLPAWEPPPVDLVVMLATRIAEVGSG